MNKRGQVTVFVIIGIVIVVLLLLFLFLRERVYIGPATQVDLEGQLSPIERHITDCIEEEAIPRLEQLGLQGGFIKTPQDTFRLHNGTKISYLCYNIQNQPYCRTRVLRLADMEEELSELLKQDMGTCLNIQGFDKTGFDLSHGQLEITTDIGQDVTIFEAKIPIKIRKGESSAEQSIFTKKIEVPLGRLFDSSRDIVTAESLIGVFDTLVYSLAKTQITNKQYVFQKLQPYPDKLYIMKIKDVPTEGDPYIFQFFIQGEPR